MSLATNQNFKKKLTFTKSADDNHKVGINVGLSCNHDIDRTIIDGIDRHINDICRLLELSYVDSQKEKVSKKSQTSEEKLVNKMKKKEDQKLLQFKKRMNIA